MIAARPSDFLLWESSPRILVADEVLASTLEARIQVHSYAAAILGRLPMGIGVVQGTGLAAPVGFGG